MLAIWIAIILASTFILGWKWIRLCAKSTTYVVASIVSFLISIGIWIWFTQFYSGDGGPQGPGFWACGLSFFLFVIVFLTPPVVKKGNAEQGLP